ncbi:MAG TPA: choice-of-anchor tandem repeat GloVer-containing protein, partial [Rhizomicrobium sp.]|nr:choice-of-anchor tandem repeat GloVer-containing protein [Rhizomicrobium sp.]
MKITWIRLLACAAGGVLTWQAPAAARTEKVVYSFAGGTDGAGPAASLIDVNGTLYGTTGNGGGTGCSGGGCGSVFALDPKTGAERVIYSFCSQQDCTDGELPEASLINVEGTLYGTTLDGGSGCSWCGTVFAVDPQTGTERVLHSFGVTDGSAPYAGLIHVNDKLYGTTAEGGTSSAGTLFAIDLKTAKLNVLYDFCREENCTDGAAPLANLINVDGVLYGTTSGGGAGGGACGCGTVFAFDPQTGAEKVIHSFAITGDGEVPRSDLTDVNGTLYGTTIVGGTYGRGTVFSLDLATGAESVVYSFCAQQNCTDGAQPETGLVNVDGTLYSTTSAGGNPGCNDSGCGTVFSLNTTTGVESVLYPFCSQRLCRDGALPLGGLI